MVFSTTRPAAGTSFFGTTIIATPNKLLKSLPADPTYSDNTGEDKVNFQWTLENDGPTGNVFTIYDWKEYRSLDMFEPIEWHIGGFSEAQTEEAKKELEFYLTLS
jgi:hypothetical protein